MVNIIDLIGVVAEWFGGFERNFATDKIWAELGQLTVL